MSRAVPYLWAVVLAALAPAAMGAGYRIDVRAQPPRLSAGSDPCAVTVSVSDDLGAPAPDGTEVAFVTTLGTVEPQTAMTSAGIVRTELRSATPGTAEVSVVVAGQREAVVVEFRGSAPRAQTTDAPMIRIAAGYVAYSADYDCITAADSARAEQGKLVVEAGNIQYEVGRGVLRAQHDVRVCGGDAIIEGDRLFYRVSSGRGSILRARDTVERISFQADDLESTTQDASSGADFTPLDTGDTSTWIVARDAIVFPRERIQFTDATVYVGNRRIVSLPYYVAPLSGQRSLLNQVLSFSSNGGVNLDLPFYYAADRSHAGSLHLRHRASGSYGYGGTGWSLGAQEQYRLGPRSTGTLTVDDVTESTRSVRLDHRLDLGAAGRASMAVNYYRFSPDYPGSLTARALYSRRLSDADLDVIALSNSFGGSANWSLDANMRWRNRELGHSGVGYDVTGNLGYGGGQTSYGGGICAGAGVGLAPPAWEMSKRTSATLDLAQQYQWAQIGGLRSTFDARAVLRQVLGGLGSMSLSYNYNLSRGGYYDSYGRQQISLNAYLSQGLLWSASGYGSYDLDRDSVFASGSISYRLPLPERQGQFPWRLDLRGSYARFSTSESLNSRVAVGRALGPYELLLCYSPTGNYGSGSYGYGYGGGKTVWIELAPLGL
ncbi:MAG TPA: invasin domain 3-containing protein [Armatimonadota bacterium]|nr:invasin domain 3-containing protein [Armatimonadota bacterium]